VRRSQTAAQPEIRHPNFDAQFPFDTAAFFSAQVGSLLSRSGLALL
jgi:hypothetical protein